MTHFAPIRFYKQTTLRTETFTQSSCYAQILLHREDPPWNFLYKVATVKLGKMVRFNSLLCLGVPTQCQRLQFYRGPWRQRFYTDFMLNTALSTNQLRVLGTEWKRETDGNRMKQSDFQTFFTTVVYKIEDVATEHLEQESSINLGSAVRWRSWGIWFYRKPTNPPNLKKALQEWLGSSYSIENDAHKQPQCQQFYWDCQLEHTLGSLIL